MNEDKIPIRLRVKGGGSVKHYKERANRIASMLLNNYIIHLDQEINFLTDEKQMYLKELNKLKENK